MKKIFFSIVLVAALSGCYQPPQQNNVSIESNNVAGFDVNKLAQLVKTSTDPQTLEKAINNPANGINNLDLDKDGNIDYVKVTEPAQNQLTVVDDVSPQQSVTVASIHITPDQASNTADMTIQGNPSYVGDNYMYHSHFSFTDFLILSYFLRPHPYYVPMYHYGYYPSYYSRTRVYNNYHTTTGPGSSSMSNSYNRRSLSSPTGSQRSFGTRNTSQPVRTGGFGTSSSHSYSGFGSSSHSSSGFGSSSRRSFGSGRSGFGRHR